MITDVYSTKDQIVEIGVCTYFGAEVIKFGRKFSGEEITLLGKPGQYYVLEKINCLGIHGRNSRGDRGGGGQREKTVEVIEANLDQPYWTFI